jgi:hypothetical protein
MRLFMAVLLGMFSGLIAYSIEPSHYGKYGNPEEPAMRPYKALWRGLKAFKYQVNNTVKEGERKAGTTGGQIQFFRGVRRGLVEIGASTYMGMAGSYPTPVEELHPANVAIEQDARTAALADIPSTVAIFGLLQTGSVGMVFGPGAVTVAQREVDRHAMTEEERDAVAAAARKTRLQNWPAAATERDEPRPAGLKYAGPWKVSEEAAKAGIVEQSPYSGDMIKKARRSGRITPASK